MTNSTNKHFHDFGKKKTIHKWNLVQLLNANKDEGTDYSFLILNTPILNPKLLLPLWNRASFRMVVDGGGNQLYSLIEQNDCENEDIIIPDVISGDFDSVEPNVLEYYRQNDTLVVHTPDQSKNDFYKALEVLISTTKSNTVIVFCDNVGRFDHIMGNLNVLYKLQNDLRMENLQVLTLGNDNLAWVLGPGQHMIYVPKDLWNEKSYCSLIPVGRPCHHVTTAGLKWNLNDSTLEFGGLVSSSNTFDVTSTENIVYISTEDPLLWSMTL